MMYVLNENKEIAFHWFLFHRISYAGSLELFHLLFFFSILIFRRKVDKTNKRTSAVAESEKGNNI